MAKEYEIPVDSDSDPRFLTPLVYDDSVPQILVQAYCPAEKQHEGKTYTDLSFSCHLQSRNAFLVHSFRLQDHLLPRGMLTLSAAWTVVLKEYQTMFATGTAPFSTLRDWLLMLLWVWTHLLQANVSNQNFSSNEDIVNKPWRPLPAGRVTEKQASILRWTLVFLNLAFSASIGKPVMYTSFALAMVEFVHDDLGLSHHPILKNVCNIGGYGTFETGATLILSKNHTLDTVAIKAIILTGLLIFTTIHAQDFADCEGDMQSGRRTLPIVFPEGSRVYIMIMVILWSIALCAIWNVGTVAAAAVTAAGTFVGWRYFDKRAIFQDERSYLFYNIWLVSVNMLPAHARFNVLWF